MEGRPTPPEDVAEHPKLRVPRPWGRRVVSDESQAGRNRATTVSR